MKWYADALIMLTTLSNGDLLWKGDSGWSDREFFKELSAAIAAVSSYQHDLTLWRGHANAGWSLAPRLLRELPSFAVAQDVVNKETEVLLAEARNARPGWLEGMTLQNTTDLDLLALLQHLGASTPLMDLTTDPYVGLYFAVAGNETNGLLLGLQAKTWTELTSGSTAYSRAWNEQTRVMADSAKGSIAYFRPPNISARIPAQRSILALGVVADKASWAHSIGTLPVETPAETWSPTRASLAFGESRSPGRPALPSVLGFAVPKRRKPFIRGILTTNKGISATSLFPDPQGFGEWRLRQECRWNRDASPTGAQEVNELEGLSERQKLSAFRAVWGKGWVTADQYAAKYRLSDWQATSDITALIAADVITRREDGQLIEGPVVHELRRRLSIRN